MLTEPRTGDGAPAAARWRLRDLDVSQVAPDTWLVIAITGVAALLRFSTITDQSFWVDEATTVHEVGLSFGAMLHAISVNEATPPVYFVLAWIWTRLFGAGELGIRSLSALIGIGLVPVAYLCGRELVSRAAGVVAAALVAFSPFMIWYSQEARSYMLLGLLCGLSLLYCARAMRTGAGRDLAVWALVSALALGTHFFSGFLIAPEALWLLGRLWRRRRGAVVAACAAVAVVQGALLPLAIGDTSHPLDQWISGLPLSTRIQEIPVDFGLSQLYRSPAVGSGLLGAAILLAVAVALLWVWGGPRERHGALVAGGLAAIVVLVPVAFAQIGHDFVFSRNFMPAWIPLAVLLAAACTVPRARLLGGALAVVVLAGFLWATLKIDGDSFYQRPDWRGVAAALGSAHGPRAIIAYDGNAAEQPLAIYLRGSEFTYRGFPASPSAVTVSEIDVVGNLGQSVPSRLPPGARLIASRVVDFYEVDRFVLEPAQRLTPSAIEAQAPRLLGPAPAGRPAVLLQTT